MSIYSRCLRPILRDIYLRAFGSFKIPSSGVHILNAHYVTPKHPDAERDWLVMETFLKRLSDVATLVKIEDAVQMISSGQLPKKECYVAFTFDDGYEECYTTIAPLLEQYGTNAAFFLNANYVSSSLEYQRGFNDRVKTTVKKPLTWTQVVELHQRGHVIGAHTLDHVRVTELTRVEYEFQLKENKRLLEEHLNYSCDYFAWTYGNLTDFSQEALEQTKKYHKIIFSADNYKQYFSYNDPQVINRRHAESFWPFSHVKYFLATDKEYNLDKI